jgi:hypothetical protein
MTRWSWIAVISVIFLCVCPRAQAQSDDAMGCVTVDNKSNSVAAFVINSCSYSVNVAWRDQGFCKDTPCGDLVSANNRESIIKVQGEYFIAACKYPDSVRFDLGGRHARCVSIGEEAGAIKSGSFGVHETDSSVASARHSVTRSTIEPSTAAESTSRVTRNSSGGTIGGSHANSDSTAVWLRCTLHTKREEMYDNDDPNTDFSRFGNYHKDLTSDGSTIENVYVYDMSKMQFWRFSNGALTLAMDGDGFSLAPDKITVSYRSEGGIHSESEIVEYENISLLSLQYNYGSSTTTRQESPHRQDIQAERGTGRCEKIDPLL